jgi:DNA-directed RNA polymerase subunit RPC12/RpoP
MQISRDADGLRFLGECAPESGFIAGDIRCAGCGRRIDPRVDSKDVSLVCTGCGFKKVFWAEAEMQVYLAENWNRLRQACTHPSVALHKSF